jgi:hypothetical protein
MVFLHVNATTCYDILAGRRSFLYK